MVANAAMLSKPDVVQYVGANASRFNIDPAAILAVANHEGLGTTPGSTWVLPKESGFNFGPPSWYSGGAGANIVAQQGASAAYWAWTPAGLDYWMQKVAESGAAGKQGLDAITAIVQGFERPREDLAAGEIINASRDYNSFQQQIQTPLPGNVIVPTPSNPGQLQIPPEGQQFPTPTNPQQTTTTTPSTSTKAAPKFSLHLFDTPWGPINFELPWDFSGILLFLAAILAIIIGALMWDKSRTVIMNTATTAAVAA